MFELAGLPENFEQLRTHVPDGFTISERLVDPVVLIDKVGPNIVANLGGVRIQKGVRRMLRAPGNRHAWVVDGSTILPLPHDAAHVFLATMGGSDPADLRYSDAIRLIRNPDTTISVEPTDGFFSAGTVVSQALDGNIVVPGLTATLFPYQARGVLWMRQTISHTGGLILADEMGLGKTIQILALLLLDPPKPESPALIICPTSLMANWVREFGRFAAGLSVMVHRGPQRAGIYRELQRTNVVIATYDTVVNDISIFSSFEWSWVICDEAQALKNPDSNRRRTISEIPRRRTIPMTGTPVENRLLDLWSLIDFAIPGLLGSRQQFEALYPDSVESAQAVSRFTDPVLLKRRVSDVADDLPKRIEIDVPLELEGALAQHYIQVREHTLAKYPVAGALVATLQLQLVCAHPWLRSTNEAADDGGDANVVRLKSLPLMTSKMDVAVALLRESFHNTRKVIVFSLFNRMGDLLNEACIGLPAAYWGAINGTTPASERQQIIDGFSAHEGPGCLVLNPKAAGAGLNITAATVVIHLTPVWNPALEAQASARAHRRGQTHPVTIYRLFYKDTVEEVMIDRSAWKSDLANESVPIAAIDPLDLKRALDMKPKIG